MKHLSICIILALYFSSCSPIVEKQTPYPLRKSKYDSLIIMAHEAKMGDNMAKAESIMDDIVACDSNNATYLVERAMVMVPFKIDKVMKDLQKAIKG